MKMFLLGAMVLLPAFATQADVITRTGTNSGDIRDLSGTLLATWSHQFTANNDGFTEPTFSNGGGAENGGQLKFGLASPTGPIDFLSFELQIVPEAGFILDELVLSQSPYTNSSSTHNGPGSNVRNGRGTATSPVGQIWTVEGYTGAITFDSGSGIGSTGSEPEITDPAVTGGNLTWQQVDEKIRNHQDDWSITLLDVDSGFNNVITTRAVDGIELNSEWITFNTKFSTAVPEPATWASGTLLGLAALINARRRRKKQLES